MHAVSLSGHHRRGYTGGMDEKPDPAQPIPDWGWIHPSVTRLGWYLPARMDSEPVAPRKPVQFRLSSLFVLTTVVAAGAWVGLEVVEFVLFGLLIWAMMALHPRTATND